MGKKFKIGATVVLVLLLVPLFLTGLFVFFWGFYGISEDVIFGLICFLFGGLWIFRRWFIRRG